jgi:hypothetical protein
MTDSAGPATEITITGIQMSPSSIGVITALPATFGSGIIDNGGTLTQDLQFGTTSISFYAKLTLSYRDGLGTVRTLTTPWKKITVK